MVLSLMDLPPRYREQAERQIIEKEKAKKSKYGNEKVTVNGMVIDSKKEARRYEELMVMLERGEIEDLKLQNTFTLQNAYTTPEGKRIRAITYKADFTYYKDGKFIVEDVKSPVTRKKPDYRMKVKMMQNVFKIEVVEV